MSDHSLISIRSDDLVTPPARCHLSREFIDCAVLPVDGISYIIGKRILGLGIMGESRFQDLKPHKLTVNIDVINAQTRRHPFCRNDFIVIGDR